MATVDLSYATTIGAMENALKNKKHLEQEVLHNRELLINNQSLYVQMLNAQKILSTVADKNTDQILKFITGMINKVLSEVFPDDIYQVKMQRKLFGGAKPHVNIELVDGKGHVLDMAVQCGTGLNQIVSFMYVICLIEIRKARRLIILDERLNGLHKTAKKFMSHIIEIFVNGGFQFIFVEYALNDLQKIYNVEKKGDVSKLIPIDGEYDDTWIFSEEADLSVLDEDYTESEEDS